ncbi:MAG TPA: GNAT family N-acetyltransferase [Syntrophales bacterium]|nr:GNAT family N-acetyltransferase [Syntrophales bacterium]
MNETRELKKTELDDLLELYPHMHTVDDPLPEKGVIEDIWQDIHESPNFIYFGTFVDGRLVSSCTLSVIPNLTRGGRPYGVIENVVTHADYRRKGYAGGILKHALNLAWQKGCYKVMLLTGRKSESVYKFYESAGFDRHAKQAFLARPQKTE